MRTIRRQPRKASISRSNTAHSCRTRRYRRSFGTEDGHVRGVKVLSYELGEPDASGRRSPVAIPGSEHEIECDAMIVALGNGSNPLLVKTTPGLNQDAKGHIVVDEKQATSKTKVWAGGDIVLGAATVILAMGEGGR